ncbi:hypothetical protein [Polyangium sp. 15x6]|uniref:hypothetical protein n=1 Tax=Polyangium sp. 15x6 TaxID=3042687 RepID=UPI00249A4A1A|nr:hypothetical protein [Polyangium sp. 15x6]
MIERVVAVAAACAVLALSGSSAAEPPPQIAFRLDYHANLPERGCPNADEFGLILAGEFGYLLVRDDAAATLRIETRTNGRGIEAELSAPNPAEDGEWRRVVTSQDCRELLYDAATLIRIRFGPGGWQGEEPPPWLLAPPVFEVESPELRMVMPEAFLDSMAGEPSEAPLTPWEGTAPRWAQQAPGPAGEEQTALQMEGALGPAMSLYGLPSVAVGGSGMVGLRWQRFALGMDVRALITPALGIGEPPAPGRTSVVNIALLGCGIAKFIDLCAVVNGSRLNFDLDKVGQLQSADTSSLGFGGRIAARWQFSSRFTLLGYTDVSGEIRNIVFRAARLDAPTIPAYYWRSPSMRVALGLAVSAFLFD